MADTKISALTVATTPLAGTEVLPIVQSGVTKQVSVANLTAGRAVSADSLTLTGSPLPATSGGTGLASVAQGDLLYASAANTLARLAKNTSATRYLSNTGSSNNPAWAQVDLTNGVTGTLPVGNGGTGTATAFTAGSVVFAGASGVFSQDNANFFWDDTNNRLGLGTTSPAGRLEMAVLAGDGEAYATIYSSNGGNEFAYLLRKSNQNTVGNTATASGDRLGGFQWQGNSGSGFTPAARIRSVQVGAASTQTPAEIKFETSNGTSFTEKLNIAPGGDVTVNVGNLVIGTSGKGIDTSGAIPIVFSINGSERGRFSAGGYFKASSDGTYVSATGSNHEFRNAADTDSVVFTATNATYTSDVLRMPITRAASSAYNMINCLANAVGQFRVSGNGVIYAQNTTVQSISDVRLKENIRNSSDGIDVINALRVVRYDWKEGFGNDQKNQLGFIAQEVESVFPEAVSEWQVNKEDKTTYKTVGPGAFIPVLVKAIQELKAELDQVKTLLEKK